MSELKIPIERASSSSDPLRLEHRRLWDLLPRLLVRQSQLEALPRRSPRLQRELVILRDQVDGLRRQSHRISEVLRAEARASAGEPRL